MEKFESLRAKYPRFVYKNYSYRLNDRDLEISFDFSIEKGINFTPRIIVKNINKVRLKHIDKKVLNNLIFHLGLIEILSYWKATCSPEIEIQAGHLDKSQIKWWQDLIFSEKVCYLIFGVEVVTLRSVGIEFFFGCCHFFFF